MTKDQALDTLALIIVLGVGAAPIIGLVWWLGAAGIAVVTFGIAFGWAFVRLIFKADR